MWGNNQAKNSVKGIDEAVDILIEQMCATDTYKAYVEEKRRVENDEGCIEKIRRYRALSEEIQNMSDDERVRDGDRIENELDQITMDARVLDYVQAEIDFARMFQKAINKITDAIDMID